MTEPLILKDEIFEIVGCAMSVHNILGHGFNEKVYENAFVVELKNKNITFQQQPHFDVNYKGEVIGHYVPDLIVNDNIIVEMKTIETISSQELGQALNYLKVTGFKIAVIINFKNPKLEWKRIVL